MPTHLLQCNYVCCKIKHSLQGYHRHHAHGVVQSQVELSSFTWNCLAACMTVYMMLLHRLSQYTLMAHATAALSSETVCVAGTSNHNLFPAQLWCVLQAQQLLLELQGAILQEESIKDLQKAKVCQVLAEADKDLIDGSDEFLQLVHVASYTQRVLCGGA